MLIYGAIPIGIRWLFQGREAVGFYELPLAYMVYGTVVLIGALIQMGTSWMQRASRWVDVLSMVLAVLIAPVAGIVTHIQLCRYVAQEVSVFAVESYSEVWWLCPGVLGLLFTLAALIMLIILSVRRLILKTREEKTPVRFSVPEGL